MHMVSSAFLFVFHSGCFISISFFIYFYLISHKLLLLLLPPTNSKSALFVRLMKVSFGMKTTKWLASIDCLIAIGLNGVNVNEIFVLKTMKNVLLTIRNDNWTKECQNGRGSFTMHHLFSIFSSIFQLDAESTLLKLFKCL